MAGKILVVRTYQVFWHKSPSYTDFKICDTLDEAERWMSENWGKASDGSRVQDQFTVAEVVDWEVYKRLYHLQGAAPHC